MITEGKPDTDVNTLKSAWADLQQQKAVLDAHLASVGPQVLSKMSDLSSITNMEALAQDKDGTKELKAYLTNVAVVKECNATYVQFKANLQQAQRAFASSGLRGEGRTRFCTMVFCADDHWCEYEGSPQKYYAT